MQDNNAGRESALSMCVFSVSRRFIFILGEIESEYIYELHVIFISNRLSQSRTPVY